MNNDLTGTQSTSHKIPVNTDFSPLTGETSTFKSMTIDFQPYDGTDTMSSAYTQFIPQQFLTKNVTTYEAYAQNPTLLQPEEESEMNTLPYSIVEQKLVMRFFYKRVRELIGKANLSNEDVKIIFESITLGTPLKNSKLAELAKQVEEQAKGETQREAHLPSSWDSKSTSAQDWTPLPIEPYSEKTEIKPADIHDYYDQAIQEAFEQYISQVKPSLSLTQVEQLKKAIAGGKINSEIAEAFNEITKIATKNTQKTYGLSETWFKGTTNPDDWKPIYLGPVTPTAVNEARGETLLMNLEKLLNSFEKAGEKVSATLDPNDPSLITMDEFRKVISKAITELKQVLRDIQLSEADKAKKSQDAKIDALEARGRRLQEQIDKKVEIAAKQRKAEKVSLAMKIVGPIVAVLSTIVGAALAIFTFGASTALIVAGIAVGAAMTAYSIVDSVTGSTQKLMMLLNESMEKAFPNNPALQKAIKALIISAVVAILIAAIILSGGGAAVSFSSQVIREVIKQLSIQLIIMAIMASNAIPELLGTILRSAGVNEKTSKIWEIIMMVITMLTVMLAMAVGGKGGISLKGITKGISEGVSSGARSVKALADRAMVALRQLIDDIKQGITEALKASLRLLKKMLASLMRGLKSIENTLNQIPPAVRDSTQHAIQNTKTAIMNMKNAIEELLELTKNLVRNPSLIKTMAPQIKQALIDHLLATGEKFKTAAQQLLEHLKTTSAIIAAASVSAAKATSEAAKAGALRTKDAVLAGSKLAAEEIQLAIKKVSDLAQALATSLSTVPGHIGKASKDILDGFKEIGTGFGKFTKNLFKLAYKGAQGQDISEELKLSTQESFKKFATSTQKTLQMTPIAINIVDGVNRGVLGLQVVKLLREVGEIKEASELLQAIIQMLEKLLTSIQTGMDTRSEEIVSLQRAYNDFYSGLSRNTTKIFQTLQG